MVHIGVPQRLKGYTHHKNGTNGGGSSQTASNTSNCVPSSMRYASERKNLVLKTTVLKVRYFHSALETGLNSTRRELTIGMVGQELGSNGQGWNQ
jgi:hypothetical protein